MSTNIRWNIFARILEDILLKRNLNWQDLFTQAGIEQDILNRLQASLLAPTSFRILSVEEMDEVIDVFNIDSHETLQLRAAIIATSVESTLIERIEEEAALQAAEQVFILTFDALIKQKGEKPGGLLSFSDDSLQQFFDQVQMCIDDGKSDRQLSRSVSREHRVRWLQKALSHFERAINLLEHQQSSLGSLKSWRQYYRQTQQEYDRTWKELEALDR